ncbi:MAG: DUF2085 domain-containing protein [Candidatus Lokiarchaeota archaeon]|nr:DUF2085 domain-containing protein [Candidatus Lokiarchaeota archaeon]
MARKGTANLADFNAWNIAFVLLYFLNATNIAIEFGTPTLGTGAVALMGVQSGLVAFLAFSRRPGTAFLTTLLAACTFHVYAYAAGIADAPGRWIPGVSIGLPAFHVTFSLLASMLVGWLWRRCRAMALPVAIPGLYATRGTGNRADARLRQAAAAKLAGVSAVASLAFCCAFLVAFPGDGAMQANFIVSAPVTAGTLALLVAAFVVAPAAPRAVYNAALTHHVIEDADHAIGVRFGKITIFLCTRCTAMLLGLFFSMYGFATLRLPVDQFLAFFLDIFIPAPVFVDWGLQRFGYRKATTRSRVITGALTGLGFALVPLASPDYAVHAAIVLMSYFAVFFIIYFASARHGYYGRDAEPDVEA